MILAWAKIRTPSFPRASLTLFLSSQPERRRELVKKLRISQTSRHNKERAGAKSLPWMKSHAKAKWFSRRLPLSKPLERRKVDKASRAKDCPPQLRI